MPFFQTAKRHAGDSAVSQQFGDQIVHRDDDVAEDRSQKWLKPRLRRLLVLFQGFVRGLLLGHGRGLGLRASLLFAAENDLHGVHLKQDERKYDQIRLHIMTEEDRRRQVVTRRDMTREEIRRRSVTGGDA